MQRIVAGLVVALVALLTLSACTDTEADGTESTPTGTPTATATGTPEPDNGGDVIGFGPPMLSVEVEATGEDAPLGLGEHCWVVESGDEVCSDAEGIVTSPFVLDAQRGQQLRIPEVSEAEPAVTAQLWPRGEGVNDGAARWVWPREGEPIEVATRWDGQTLVVEIPQGVAGEYVLDLSVAFEQGTVEYGLQIDVVTDGDVENRTGIEAVDRAITAVLADDAQSLAEMTAMMSIPCEEPPAEGLGGPPLCEAGESEGDVVEVLPVAYCEGTYSREPLQVMHVFVEEAVGLHSVVEAPEEDRPTNLWPAADYYLNFYAETALGEHGIQLWMQDGQIVVPFFGCAHPIEALMRHGEDALPVVLGPLPPTT